MAETGSPAARGPAGEGPGRGPAKDPRQHRPRMERQLIIGGFVILFVVGGGLVWLLYGSGAFLGSWLCLAGGAALLALMYLLLRRPD